MGVAISMPAPFPPFPDPFPPAGVRNPYQLVVVVNIGSEEKAEDIADDDGEDEDEEEDSGGGNIEEVEAE